ncbi:MAG: acyl-CoA dehydrogenase family protein [Dehalococcoidia bacterium]
MDFNFTPEEEDLRRRVRKVAVEELAPLAPEVDESDDVSWEVVKIMAREGLFGYIAPREYGGHGVVRVTNICIVREELARACAQADTTFAMNGLGGYPIVLAGSEEQKRRYLPPLASGEKLGSFALTEPDGGSDVAAMKTVAVRDGDSYVLNGMKRFVSQTGAAHTYTVFAKTDPQARSRAISAFVVEEGTPGFDTHRKLKLLAPHAIGEPLFEDCRIPASNLLGQEGDGMKIALSTLDMFRTTVAAAVTGLALAAYDEAISYAQHRFAFGQPLAEFQATQFKIADMVTSIDAARLLLYRAAWLKDQGQDRVILEASMAKLFATEMAQRVADEALQIHGGMGVVKGMTVERIFREVRAARIYEGTSEIQRITIAREIFKRVRG